MAIDLFPLGLASGDRFCNREEDRAWVRNNICTNKHTVLISPRRYGKSSLAHKVIDDLSFPYVAIDLFVAYDDKLVCERLVKGISQLVAKITPFSKKALQLVEDCFKNARAIIKAGHIELEISFAKPRFDPVSEIFETLSGLDKLAKKQKKQVVVLLDEFQNIALVNNSNAIQGAIRSLAQATKHIAFIFSGSSRKMLSHMFDDRSQPLYMLCKKLYLERIRKEHYVAYIQSAAKVKWQSKLDEMVIDRILTLTECHPFYVNLLCSELWVKKDKPNLQVVDNTWFQCLQEDYRHIQALLEPLSVNQLNVLRIIACSDYLSEPTSFDFIQMVGLSVGSVQRALSYLFEHDYIYRSKEGIIEVVDPLIKMALRKLS
jgi:AAA+ ATPase superfamily predicted ATPase